MEILLKNKLVQKVIPAGITAKTVFDNYLTAIGGKVVKAM